MVGRRVSPAPTKEDATAYLNSVRETFRDEPEKYQEFLKHMIGLRYIRFDVDVDNVIARVEELMKDHKNLFLRFKDFLSADQAKRFIMKAEQRVESDDTEKKHADGENFLNKLKTRFQSLDTHIVGSFLEIMNMFREGNMSKKEVHEEVIDLLYYHEDLIEDFSRFFTKNDPAASSSLLVHLLRDENV